jgi:hypothetical protein
MNRSDWMRGRQASERNQPDHAGTPFASPAHLGVLRAKLGRLPEVRDLLCSN